MADVDDTIANILANLQYTVKMPELKLAIQVKRDQKGVLFISVDVPEYSRNRSLRLSLQELMNVYEVILECDAEYSAKESGFEKDVLIQPRSKSKYGIFTNLCILDSYRALDVRLKYYSKSDDRFLPTSFGFTVYGRRNISLFMHTRELLLRFINRVLHYEMYIQTMYTLFNTLKKFDIVLDVNNIENVIESDLFKEVLHENTNPDLILTNKCLWLGLLREFVKFQNSNRSENNEYESGELEQIVRCRIIHPNGRIMLFINRDHNEARNVVVYNDRSSRNRELRLSTDELIEIFDIINRECVENFDNEKLHVDKTIVLQMQYLSCNKLKIVTLSTDNGIPIVDVRLYYIKNEHEFISTMHGFTMRSLKTIKQFIMMRKTVEYHMKKMDEFDICVREGCNIIHCMYKTLQTDVCLTEIDSVIDCNEFIEMWDKHMSQNNMNPVIDARKLYEYIFLDGVENLVHHIKNHEDI